MLKKNRLYIYFGIYILQQIVSNLAHPVTPTLISNLEFNDYMFGFTFAAMALGSFLVSPLLGKVSDASGRIKIMGYCCMGYAVGQYMFGNAISETNMVLARFVAGVFIGGISVTQLAYIIDLSDETNKGKNLIIVATLQAVFGPIGFLIGGVIGTYSIELLFIVQAISLVLVGLLSLFLLRDVEKQREQMTFKKIFKSANPITPFFEAKSFMNRILVYSFIMVVIAGFGATAYDQCFNYYIKDFYGFTPDYNGALKALIGVIALLTNSTVAIYLTKKTNISHSIIYIFTLASIVTLAVSLVLEFYLFVVLNMIYYALNAIYLPMQQNIISKQVDSSIHGQVMGFYNSVNFLGMVGGSMFAGLIYSYGPSLSFLTGSICFMLCAMIAVVLFRKEGLKDV